MPRALTIERTAIPSSDRERYMASLRAKAAHFRAAHCRFWVFEDAEVRGSFIEFTEGDDEETLGNAYCTLSESESLRFPIPLYQLVELD